MLRSVEYAVEAVRAQSPEGTQDLSLARFRSAFLDGYLSRATSVGAVFVPADRQVATAWIAFFECERALYEVEYEANSRPSWVHIPLGGVVRILTGQEP
jgi:predicted trehalose synthase